MIVNTRHEHHIHRIAATITGPYTPTEDPVAHWWSVDRESLLTLLRQAEPCDAEADD